MLKIIVKTEIVGKDKASAVGSLHFENDTTLDGRVQVAAEIECALRALKDNYRREFLLAVLSVVTGDDEE